MLDHITTLVLLCHNPVSLIPVVELYGLRSPLLRGILTCGVL
jgi:hypothetical protein